MPLEPYEELKQIRSQPLPGGHGRIQRRLERERQLSDQIVESLFVQMNDCEGARGLFELYMELLCGKDVDDPGIVLTEPFLSLWKDYHPDDDGEEITGE
jgi:hypothetical protein